MTVLFQIYDMTTRRPCSPALPECLLLFFGHPVFKDGDADNTSLSFSKSICRVNATPARSGSLFFNSIPAFKQARFTSARGLYSLGIVKLSRSKPADSGRIGGCWIREKCLQPKSGSWREQALSLA
jgi:hypothetical protein